MSQTILKSAHRRRNSKILIILVPISILFGITQLNASNQTNRWLETKKDLFYKLNENEALTSNIFTANYDKADKEQKELWQIGVDKMESINCQRVEVNERKKCQNTKDSLNILNQIHGDPKRVNDWAQQVDKLKANVK